MEHRDPLVVPIIQVGLVSFGVGLVYLNLTNGVRTEHKLVLHLNAGLWRKEIYLYGGK